MISHVVPHKGHVLHTHISLACQTFYNPCDIRRMSTKVCCKWVPLAGDKAQVSLFTYLE